MSYIVTPLSYLINHKNKYNRILNSTDFFELRDFEIDNNFINKKLVKFYHSEFQINHPLDNNKLNIIEKKLSNYRNINFISFHLASNFLLPKLNKNHIFLKGRKQSSKDQMLINAKINIKRIKKRFPGIKVLIENNNYYDTGAYQFVTDANFISKIVLTNNINFLFDLSHAIITSFNKKISLQQYMSDLPMQKMTQLHISRPILKKNFYYDAHFLPILNNFLKQFLYDYKPKYITIEYYKNLNKLIKINKKIKFYGKR